MTKKAPAQFNIRLDPDIYKKYRDYCARNGLDPVLLVVNYIQRLVRTQYNVQERLWELMSKEE